MMPGRLNKEKGIILPIVLILTLVLMITGLVFVSLGVQENSLVRREIVKRQAFYLAEAGVEDARVQLGQDWYDYTTIDATLTTSLGEGTYHADISKSGSSNREIISTATVGGISKTVIVILKSLGVTSAIKTGGEVNIISHAAEINGDIEENSDSFDNPDEYFKTVFGISKPDMKEIAQSSPNIYYDSAINDPIVENITWINGGEEQSQITASNWTGSGILIVDGNLKITGGTFDGIIWVTGSLEITAGNPVINGAIFVESDTTIDITGNLTLNYDADVIANVLGDPGSTDPGSTGVIVESWEEL